VYNADDVTGIGVRSSTKFPNEQVRSMIGIVLVTHGRLGSEFRAALEHVVGPQKQIDSIAIGPDDNIEQRRQDIDIGAVHNRNCEIGGRAAEHICEHDHAHATIDVGDGGKPPVALAGAVTLTRWIFFPL
jgi:hypothetical protein